MLRRRCYAGQGDRQSTKTFFSFLKKIRTSRMCLFEFLINTKLRLARVDQHPIEPQQFLKST